MAYPMGLPPWEAIKVALEVAPHEGGLDGTPAQGGVLEPDTASLWCAGREFVRGELVSDRLGKNEKTKVVAKLQKPGSGAPAREPVVSEDERKAMMAHYFKRQEELKASPRRTTTTTSRARGQTRSRSRRASPAQA